MTKEARASKLMRVSKHWNYSRSTKARWENSRMQYMLRMIFTQIAKLKYWTQRQCCLVMCSVSETNCPKETKPDCKRCWLDFIARDETILQGTLSWPPITNQPATSVALLHGPQTDVQIQTWAHYVFIPIHNEGSTNRNWKHWPPCFCQWCIPGCCIG
jgi:hypothetical protein